MAILPCIHYHARNQNGNWLGSIRPAIAFDREPGWNDSGLFMPQPGSDWSWEQMMRDELRRMPGFFIGEPPVDPFAPSETQTLGTAAVALVAAVTGPPWARRTD